MFHRHDARRSAIAACLVAAALLPVFLAGCSSKEPGRYYNHDKAFSIKFPEGWTVSENVLGAAVIANGPLEGTSQKLAENISVVVVTNPDELTPEQCAEQSVATMRRMVADFLPIDNGTSVINARPAKWMINTYRMNDIDLKVMTYILTKGRTGYLITCTATKGSFDSYRLVFESAVLTFRLE